MPKKKPPQQNPSEKKIWKGLWKNDKGSLMRIQDVKKVRTGTRAARYHFQISGKYQTGVGRPGFIEKFPLVGFVTGDLIVFSVSFRLKDSDRKKGKPDSMTSWSGQILPTTNDKGRQKLRTLWYLTEDEPEDRELQHGWATILAGADFFEKISNNPDAELKPTTKST